jgi:hypothetical protein
VPGHPGANGAATRDDVEVVSAIRPMFLLADSQLLFWKEGDALFLARVREALGARPLRAAYLGASNGDVPDYYEIFVAAMEGIGVGDCRMIPASPSAADRAFFEDADIILLAGGDAARGYRAFQESGLAERILARYAAGAVLIGISAGAMQLGLYVWTGRGDTPEGALRLAPMVVAVHDEPEWAGLTQVVTALEGAGRGLGIPTGGGAVVHPDLSVEPVRRALVEISVEDGIVRRALLMAGDAGARSGAG